MSNLVLHIDDLGLSNSTNSAAFQLHDNGLIFSGSVMPNTYGFDDFIKGYLLRKNEMDIGAHITLTSEWDNAKTGPISELRMVESLVDDNGLFFKGLEDTNNFDRQHVEIEIKAQIEFILDHGVSLSHIDSHMGVLLFKNYIDIYLKIARKFGLNAFCSYPKNYFKEWYWFYQCDKFIQEYQADGGVVLGDFDNDSLCDLSKYQNIDIYEQALSFRLQQLKKNNSITISHILDPHYAEEDHYIQDKHMRYMEYQFLLDGKFEELIKKLGFNLITTNKI